MPINMITQRIGMVYGPEYPPEYAAYNTQFPGEMEIIGGKIWDTQTYVSGATLKLEGWFNKRATNDLSNMTIANALPNPTAFLIRTIRFFVKQRPRVVTTPIGGNPDTGALDNIVQLCNTGVWEMTIGNKTYMQDPLWTLTAGGGAYGVIAFTGNAPQQADYAQNGTPDPRAVNSLSKPLFLAPQINFTGILYWPVALTLAGGDTTITILLEGDLIRPVQ